MKSKISHPESIQDRTSKQACVDPNAAQTPLTPQSNAHSGVWQFVMAFGATPTGWFRYVASHEHVNAELQYPEPQLPHETATTSHHQ
jgi:hypothetical protein